MTTIEQAPAGFRPTSGLLDRERIIAKAGFNRWLVPPAALCIHLCIGMAYGFSVFWIPLSRAIGLDKSVSPARRGRQDGAIRVVRNRQGRPRRQGGAVLGPGRRSAGLGRVEDADQRDEDLLIGYPSRLGRVRSRETGGRAVRCADSLARRGPKPRERAWGGDRLWGPPPAIGGLPMRFPLISSGCRSRIVTPVFTPDCICEGSVSTSL